MTGKPCFFIHTGCGFHIAYLAVGHSCNKQVCCYTFLGIRLRVAHCRTGPVSFSTRNIDEQKTLTIEQILVLLEKSKDTPIHMQVLFNVLMGLRRSEINGVKIRT